MVKFSRKIISLSDLWVSSHDKLSDFYTSSWQRGDSPVPLLVVRLAALLLAVCILGWSVYEGRNVYWLIYLTNWGLVLVTAMLLSGVGVSFMAALKRIPETDVLPWYVSTYWFLYNVAVHIAFMITLLYWILLYNPEAAKEGASRLFWLDVVTHGFNSGLALLEVLVSRTPLRMAHIYQPLSVGLWYAAFTGIYYAAGGTDGNGFPFIYEVLDWQQGKRSGIMVLLSAAGLIALYCVMYGITFLRNKLTTFLFRSSSIKLAVSPADLRMPGPDGFV